MISGVINVYKEAGYTSHDVVARLRRILHQKRIGHTGTLDPDAVGVLPVCLGKATKLVETLAEGTKTYETVLLLGKETDTQDISGEVIREQEVHCSEEEVKACLPSFLGEQDQIPPMYSAKKQNGKKLYELAREGITVERKAARIRIEDLEVLDCFLPRIRLRITCSKGTYIRTLCHDIGQKLGCGGCMVELVRTRVGEFRIGQAWRLEEIRQKAEEGCLSDMVMPPEQFFLHLPAWRIQAADALLHNGNALPEELCPGEGGSGTEEKRRIYDSGGRFMGIYLYKPQKAAWFPVLFFYDQDT